MFVSYSRQTTRNWNSTLSNNIVSWSASGIWGKFGSTNYFDKNIWKMYSRNYFNLSICSNKGTSMNILVSVHCSVRATSTLYNVILRIPRNLLENREDIKYLTHPFYHTNLDWFSKEWSKKKFFWRKKFKMVDFSKWPFCKISNSRKFFAKILQIGPLVGKIDWCQGHWYSST